MTLRIKNNNSVFAQAERIAASYGFTRPDTPSPQAPMVPMDLGELTPDEMMNLFAEFSAWAGYAAIKVAEAEAAEEDTEGDLKVAEAKFIINEMEVGGEEKVTVARSRRDSDPEVIRLRKLLRKRRAVRKLLTTYFNNYERSAAVLSRELTRRSTLFPQEMRSSK